MEVKYISLSDVCRCHRPFSLNPVPKHILHIHIYDRNIQLNSIRQLDNMRMLCEKKETGSSFHKTKRSLRFDYYKSMLNDGRYTTRSTKIDACNSVPFSEYVKHVAKKVVQSCRTI